jgi:alpha-galactosidase
MLNQMNGFMLEYNGHLFSEAAGFSATGSVHKDVLPNCSSRFTQIFKSVYGDVQVKNIFIIYPEHKIVEKWIEIENIAKCDVVISRMDSMHGIMPEDTYVIKYFLSDWGKEYTPVDELLEENKTLQVTSGRSSMGMHPWYALMGKSGRILTCAVAWSGNWIARFEKQPNNCYSITSGINNWCFEKTLKCGQTVEAIHVIYNYLENGDLDDTSLNFARWGKEYWYPANSFLDSRPVEWNHWWPYEDKLIHEDVVKANINICKEIGITICTLDAGWFGSSSENSNWYKVRGDWDKINSDRFPSGIKALADYAHMNGLKFGIWCEIEAIGQYASLAAEQPDYIAQRDGQALGYVCFGNPETRKWAYMVLETLITVYGADWIKLDFNLNPGAGCNRTDHGHGPGDGLYEHYMGYYKMLDDIRSNYPKVVLENCSSGGLRTDLGIMKHAHITFISDLDYPVHALQVFWGITTMLHPSVCLQWSWSQSIDDRVSNIIHEPILEHMPLYKFDYMIRNSMMKNPGLSYRLPDLPGWCLDRLKHHINFYKDCISKFVGTADFCRLTGQARRTGEGTRWNAFEYISEDRNDAVIFVFRLPGAENEAMVSLRGLDADAIYQLDYQDSGKSFISTGSELTGTGIELDLTEDESSEIILLKKIH